MCKEQRSLFDKYHEKTYKTDGKEKNTYNTKIN